MYVCMYTRSKSLLQHNINMIYIDHFPAVLKLLTKCLPTYILNNIALWLLSHNTLKGPNLDNTIYINYQWKSQLLQTHLIII